MQKSTVFRNMMCCVHITFNSNGFDNIWRICDINPSFILRDVTKTRCNFAIQSATKQVHHRSTCTILALYVIHKLVVIRHSRLTASCLHTVKNDISKNTRFFILKKTRWAHCLTFSEQIPDLLDYHNVKSGRLLCDLHICFCCKAERITNYAELYNNTANLVHSFKVFSRIWWLGASSSGWVGLELMVFILHKAQLKQYSTPMGHYGVSRRGSRQAGVLYENWEVLAPYGV